MNKYDVIIIGGGLGGLSCGAMLSKEGLYVCVLEQHSVIGGCLQSFHRGGYILDTGMHYVGSLSEGQVMHQYFKYLGVIDSLKLQKLDENGFDRFHFQDGTTYSHAMGYDRFIDNLATCFPDEYHGLKQLCDSIKDVGSLISPKVLYDKSIASRGIECMSISAHEKICSHIKNKILRNVFAGNCGLYAGNRDTTSFYEYGMITHSYIEGAYRFVDGSQQLADALTKEIHDNGGVVLTKYKVNKIRLNNNQVEFVETENGERFVASNVISSLHPTITFSLLDNNTVFKKAFFSRINSLKNSYGLFTTYLLMKPQTTKYVNHNSYLFNSSDVWSVEGNYKGYNIPGTFLCMQPNSQDQYTNVITLLTPMPLNQYEKWIDTELGHRGAEYNDFKHGFGEAVIDFVSQYYPDLRENIHKIHTASPLTYRDYTSTPDGSAYGVVKDFHNPLITLFPARTKIANLLLTGQNLNIHGCLGTVVSAAITCSEILGKEYLSNKIENA